MMRLPAVAIASVFACGIAIGLWPGFAQPESSPMSLRAAVPASIGHLPPQLLEGLGQARIPTLRTDSNGALHILTNGKKFEGSCFMACPEVAVQLNSAKPKPPQNQ